MTTDLQLPDFDDVIAAHERIAPHIHRTPVLTSEYFNKLTGAELFFKCENFQKAGAFKVRGACNAVFGLSDTQAKNGVATHSSGNHGLSRILCTLITTRASLPGKGHVRGSCTSKSKVWTR